MTRFAHELLPYLPRLDVRYTYFIEFGALHERGNTYCNSKLHIRHLVRGDIAKGTHDNPCMYRPCMQDVSDDESEEEFEDTASAAGDAEADAEADGEESPIRTRPTRVRKHRKSCHKVDPQRLAELDLDLANDITACYEHEETAVEHLERFESSTAASSC